MFAVPGDIDRPHVQGCHALIRDGATLARNAGDVLAQLRITSTATQLPMPQARNPLHAAILAAVRERERSADELAEALAIAPVQILTA